MQGNIPLRSILMQTDLFGKRCFHNAGFGYDQCFKNSAFDKPEKKIPEKEIKVKQMLWLYMMLSAYFENSFTV